jgi:hypothetical protein
MKVITPFTFLIAVLALAVVAIVVASILIPEAAAHDTCRKCVVCVCAWCRC